MTKYINEPNHLRLKPEGVEPPDCKLSELDANAHPEFAERLNIEWDLFYDQIERQPTFLKVGDGWERFKEGDLIDGGEVEIGAYCAGCASLGGGIRHCGQPEECGGWVDCVTLKHKEAGEERKYTYEEVREALRVGVNIGMQNVEQPRFEGDYNFNLQKALKETDDYLSTLKP